ncbi:MAG: hypothetical protein LYZ66_06775 [Nitrososphaerales archaeon]|nr:hypothetical protein [Nitrososphaerales archaeon]
MQNDNHDKNDNLNPFSPQQPAQPEYFADRKEELDDFRRMALNSARLRIPAPENYAIVGTWGQGKTSMLYKFRQMIIEDLQKEIKCVCIYFPLSPESTRSWETFTLHFLQDVPSTLMSTKSIKQKIRNEIGRWEMNLNLGVVEAKRKKTQRTLRMVDALESLWEEHLAPAGTQVAFIMLDDLHLFPLQSEENAFLTLRTTFQELVNRKCNYSLVVTAPTLLFTDIAEVAEPLGRFFKQVELRMFTFEDAKEAIERRLESAESKVTVSDEAIRSLVERTGGHPYLLVFAMHELIDGLRGSRTVEKGSFDRCWPRIEQSLGKQIFAQKFQHASPTERRLLVEIARTSSALVSPGQFGSFKGASRLFSRLEEDELLIRNERGRYRLFHPLFSEYLKKQ